MTPGPSVADRLLFAVDAARRYAFLIGRAYLMDEAESVAGVAIAEIGTDEDDETTRRAVQRHVARLARQYRGRNLGRRDATVLFRPEERRAEVEGWRERDADRLAWAMAAIGRLHPRRRRAIRLRLGIGSRPYKLDEIAAVMGIQQATVSKTIRDGLNAIRAEARREFRYEAIDAA